jgi:hypothetical protein
MQQGPWLDLLAVRFTTQRRCKLLLIEDNPPHLFTNRRSRPSIGRSTASEKIPAKDSADAAFQPA